jgi:hypothetical protein
MVEAMTDLELQSIVELTKQYNRRAAIESEVAGWLTSHEFTCAGQPIPLCRCWI